MNLMVNSLVLLCGLGVLLFFVAVFFSPFETLRWWAGWSRRQQSPDQPLLPVSDIQAKGEGGFLVYLTAIGRIEAEPLSGRERGLFEAIMKYAPETMIIADVYPFSVTNNPLNGERQLAWLWDRINRSRYTKAWIFSTLIFVRNLIQVGVSGDPRYGPMYNAGVAREIAASLIRHGYPITGGRPIFVMGWSGGGQIAVGVSRYLNQALDAPVYVISLGGVMADDPAISYVEHLYHLQGSRDRFPLIGTILYPGRWPFLKSTPWHQAAVAGKYTEIDPGPMKHTGRDDYYDGRSTLPNGQRYVDRTAEVIAQCMSEVTGQPVKPYVSE